MEKRNIPKPLQQLLKFDGYITNSICTHMDKVLPPEKYRKRYRALELTCHGIPWIAGWLAFVWIIWEPALFEMQVNFLIGLLIDIVAVAILKAMTRRRRPTTNRPDMLLMVGPDKYSFPSGHVSRSCFIAYFFNLLHPLSPIYIYVLWTWAISVSISRVLMRRHHILDVVGGVLLGICVTFTVSFFWLSKHTCVWLVNWLSDEQVSGPEYDV